MTDATIADLVEKLAVQTTRHDSLGRPLLVQLRRAVWGDLGQTRTGAASPQRLGIVAAAADLWTKIATEIGTDYAAATGAAPSKSTMVNLLAWHVAFAAGTDRGDVTPFMIDVAGARLAGYVKEIEEYFDSPLSTGLRDFACPNCGQTRAEWGGGELRTEGNAILVTVQDGELVASCRNALCFDNEGNRSKWTGLQQIEYMARRGGIDVTTLQSAIREAMQPLPELPYNPDEGRKTVITPEDNGYTVARASVPS